MKKHMIWVFVFAALLIGEAVPVTATGPVATRTVSVTAYADYNANPYFPPIHGDANAIWTDSGFMLKTGMPVTVTATGTSTLAPGVPVGPAGPGGSCPSFCSGPGLPMYALIGRIGTGQPFFVGAGPLTVDGSGELSFAFNDGLYADNSGAFAVTLSYECQQDNGAGDQGSYRCGL